MGKKEEVKSDNDKVKNNTNNEDVNTQNEKKEESKVPVKVEETKKVRKPISEKAVIVSIIVAILVIAFGLFFYFFYKTNMKAVATYDGGKVTKSEFSVYYKAFAPMLTYFGYPESVIPEQIINKAAVDKILVQEAKKAGVKLTDEETKSIEEQLSDDSFVKTYEQQGVSKESLKKLYYDQSLINKYSEKLQSETKEEDLLNYIKSIYGDAADMNEYNTSHILFKTVDNSYKAISDEDKAKKKETAEAILKRALAGEDFATLAKENSEDSTKDNGGVYTFYMDGQTDEAYSNAVKAMKVGDVSATLIESQYGYHIIKLNSINENGRIKSAYDRENYISEKMNNISVEKNFNVNTSELNSAIKDITGKEPVTDEQNTTNTTVNQ